MPTLGACHRRRPQTPVSAVKAARTVFEPLIAGSPHCNHLPFYVKVPDPAPNDTGRASVTNPAVQSAPVGRPRGPTRWRTSAAKNRAGRLTPTAGRP